MRAALRNSYVEVVFFMGVNERYPYWFMEELYNRIVSDDYNYTFYAHYNERTHDYHEKQLIGDDTVFIRKPNGELHITTYNSLSQLYREFTYDAFTNSGIWAFNDDVVEYVECLGGEVLSEYPNWFYEYFTEAVNYPDGEITIFLESEDGELTITDHCCVLRNKYGEIRVMGWTDFIKFYDPEPEF